MQAVKHWKIHYNDFDNSELCEKGKYYEDDIWHHMHIFDDDWYFCFYKFKEIFEEERKQIGRKHFARTKTQNNINNHNNDICRYFRNHLCVIQVNIFCLTDKTRKRVLCIIYLSELQREKGIADTLFSFLCGGIRRRGGTEQQSGGLLWPPTTKRPQARESNPSGRASWYSSDSLVYQGNLRNIFIVLVFDIMLLSAF